ncbi:MAG: hypothetical protein AM1032_000310 [Mycoplasmataceae bacterium]|nr:MAG: hypothetical protein AM1032_000310 [Mycoplasmataceae bacterium]
MINIDDRRKFIISNFSEKKRILDISQIKERSNIFGYDLFQIEGSKVGCGDSISFLVKKENNSIKEIFFSDQDACIISIAAANIMCNWLEKEERSFSEINKVLNNIRMMISGKSYDLSNCEEMEVFQDLTTFSNRVECINLIIKSFEKIIEK